MDMEQLISTMQRNAIQLEIKGAAPQAVGATRFGGRPDVPPAFVWPAFTTATFDDDEEKPRPLSFLAQFNCAELAPFDTEHLLPPTGLLSFFYECGSMRWGFDPKDEGCARVFWFEDASALSPADFPAELEKDCRFPAIGISARCAASTPDWEDFETAHSAYSEAWDEFEEVRGGRHEPSPDVSSKLLGWPDIIQNNMTQECELVSRGYYLGGLWEDVTDEDRRLARETSTDGWRLLFQLDEVTEEGFELMFGDCGRVYFYIRKEDLAARRFDRVWLVLQCY